jgi:hypothetical protein
MKKIIATAAAAAAVITGTIVAAAPSEAATRPSCSRAEFASIQVNRTTLATVQRMCGRGRQTDYESGIPGYFGAMQSRTFNTANRYGAVYIDFQIKHGVWIAYSKSAFWGF